eukprot:TRINITY_DN32015_c0_g1_i1.p1 TRINITY_DN32015_c0_g1~~TRINITY_DN32015_c0_g1_i1.p1  ORF type:complete len:234 (+),score=87.95 TRINITY_DN32015_c0_g1_i1:50-751(+)
MTIEIGYWDIRGLKAALVMMCEYAGAEYKCTDYTIAEVKKWFEERKPELQKENALMNLPFIVDGDFVVTQSNACMYYLGRKFGMNGKTEAEIIDNDQMLCEVFDLRNRVVQTCYPSDFTMGGMEREGPQFKEKMAKHWEAADGAFSKFEAWFAQRKTKFCGSESQPFAADFHLFEMIDQHERMKAVNDVQSLLENRPHLAAFYKAFKELPQLQKYFAGALYAQPLNNVMAHFK